MQDLRRALEHAGFDEVRTILSSGNAIFNSDEHLGVALERRVESAIADRVGRRFPVILRTAEALAALLASDPYAPYGLPAGAKRVVSFLKTPMPSRLQLPLTEGSATVIHQSGAEVFTAYIPGPDGPVFMKLIERAFGTEVTTRTWDTITKCARG
jgi:uncharacterized protein (DUF1697 family)